MKHGIRDLTKKEPIVCEECGDTPAFKSQYYPYGDYLCHDCNMKYKEEHEQEKRNRLADYKRSV
jgi:DNA-directed RNA polymerase subunit RPC12/RpoP